MSTPDALGSALDCWIEGFPTATLPRIRLFVVVGNTTMPLVLPIAVFDSTRLLSPVWSPMPKSVAVPVV
jgi:hypothetical protein